MNNMNTTEPKLQTPLTDAKCKEAFASNYRYYEMCDFARSLEIKLQEAERQRDEAKLQATQGNDTVYRWRKLVTEAEAERDQLIKVVEKFHEAHEACTFQDSEELQSEALDAYSALPHVQARK